MQRWSDVQDGGRQASLRQISLVLTKEIYTRVNSEYTNAQELHFYRTRVRSLGMLVTNSLTHSLSH